MSELTRIIVVGTSGAGKTTMAAQLAARLGLRHVELDALFWDANWTPAPDTVFRERLLAALPNDGWVVDGNYSRAHDIHWGRANTVVWLDYSLPVILARVTRRTFRRIATRETLWNGNQERLRTALFSRESIFLWALQTYRRYRRDYANLLAQPQHARLTVIHLRSPRAAEAWLAQLPSAAPSHTSAPATPTL